MNVLKQTEPYTPGKGAVIGKLVDTKDDPISVLETMRLQIEKTREWNCECLDEGLKQASDNLTGIKLTMECLEMQMAGVLESPLLKASKDLYEALDALVTRFDTIRLRGYVGSNLFDQAHAALKKARGE